VTPLIVIRPQPGCDATVSTAREQGLPAIGFPLFEVVPAAWDAPDPADVDALLIGSANALRHAGPALARYRGKPAYAVGGTSAEAARAAGLEVVGFGSGGLQQVIARLQPGHRRLLRLAGKTRIALEAPAGATIVERVVYASTPRPMPAELAALLREPATVLIHSGEAARHFAALCDGNAIGKTHLALVTIGERVTQAAGSGWRTIATADTPDDAAMLALARQICQTAPLRGTSQDRA
jgi:uroporphyrinogen-III synthase